MDEMKSALDRALERAERMGKLSPKEMQQHNEIKYKPIGEAIAQRFFEHGQTGILAEQLSRLEEECKVIATESAVFALISNIGLENSDLNLRSIEGIACLKGSTDTQKASDDIVSLFGQYEWQKKLLHEENSEDMEKEANERMAAAGITGHAIAGFNIEKNDQWIQKADELSSEFESRLSEMKKSLGQAVSSE